MTKALTPWLYGLALTMAVTPAAAHRQWLLPSATIFSGTNDTVTVDAAASNDLFFPDHRPANLASIKVWAPDGSSGQIENGATGRVRSTFDVRLDKPGTWKIGTEMAAVMGSYRLNGEEVRVGGRPGGPPPATAPGSATPARLRVTSASDIPAGASDVKLTQISSHNEIFVTAGVPTATVFQPTNKGLEMVPITHPAELVAGEPARFRFLVDGKRAAGLKLSVLPGGKRYRDGDGLMSITTAQDGIATVIWPAAGMYWLNASLADDAGDPVRRISGRRMSYSTTLEVMAP
ncbi:DUF4198 domain-containing protein [uncultured Sphingomonas sp.]|uniref:DUF4198 domain-containing protein n=1 Tax=uncultured Sphingomonas sp. TaxID=158754 RepID=UPI0025DE4777|nr:DUF4198 domain-containing protein [uncultured Sphingomonas sp.]